MEVALPALGACCIRVARQLVLWIVAVRIQLFGFFATE